MQRRLVAAVATTDSTRSCRSCYDSSHLHLYGIHTSFMHWQLCRSAVLQVHATAHPPPLKPVTGPCRRLLHCCSTSACIYRNSLLVLMLMLLQGVC
jgi:hypothetical protein